MSNGILYDKWFQVADADHDGRLTGPDAVAFFERSGLPREILANVWELANSSRQGYLDRQSFHKAMDLVSMAQQGIPVTRENFLAQQDAGFILPKVEGLDLNDAPSAASNPFGASAPPHQPSMRQGRIASDDHLPTAEKDPKKKSGRRIISGKVCTSIVDGLKHIYFTKVKPLEEAFKFGSFFSPLLSDSDFEAKPSVLLLGQYSTGKTTFIKKLLGRSYPGTNIGPEPTTDRFTVVFHGLEERRVPGQTLAVQPDKPYQGLSHFGTGFLSRFEGSQCPAPLLEEITLVDTPGVLSGEKQRIERTYNFVEVVEWFASRCDLILLLFDPYKLDISDEFKNVIHSLRGHDDKIRVVLNKADQVDQQQLMRVYGALMWSLGKVFRSPEVCKVYVGSFNSEAPISEDKNPYGKTLFEAEHEQLLLDLYDIPKRSCDRKVNEFVKRVRAAKIHMLILGQLRSQMPSMFGTAKAQQRLLDDLLESFKAVQREYHLPVGDFPDVNRYREMLSAYDLLSFPKLTKDMVKKIDDVLSVDVPNLLKQFDNPFP